MKIVKAVVMPSVTAEKSRDDEPKGVEKCAVGLANGEVLYDRVRMPD